ncbi:Myb-like DNA-binding domain protein [Ostertagia ostertagi]
MFGDVKSILVGEANKEEKDDVKPASLTNASRKSSVRRSESNFKRPDKMHRELYSLIGGSDVKEAGTIVPTEIRKGFAQLNAQLGGRPVRKYKWVPFTNEARNDSLQLYHWQRVDKLETPEPYPFAKFNKVINIPDFTDEEYEKYFKVENWTLEETRHLFDVCRRFDIRWPIVHDRYDREKYGLRSMEDLKERFYAIVNEIAIMKDPACEPICYDADHERRRKEQMIKLYNRTKMEMKEEEFLINELKKIEARKKERERKAHDLQKLINTEPPASPSASGVCMSPALGKKRNLYRQKGSSTLVSASSSVILNPVDTSNASAIRFSEFKSAGPHLRSQEMKLPTNIGQKKLKNIETVLNKCQLEYNPVGTELVVAAYNEFRSNVVALQELKTMLQTTEFELESMRSRMIEEGRSTTCY